MTGDGVFQPSNQFPADAIATIDAARAFPKASQDYAAARLLGQLKTSNDIVGLGVIAGISQPQLGQRLVKSGATTGITEGQVFDITNDQIRISAPDDIDLTSANFAVTEPGDSGAIWIDPFTRNAVALNTAGFQDGSGDARAVRLSTVMADLQLTLQ